MIRPFADTTRRNIAELCAAFTRLPERTPAPEPQPGPQPSPESRLKRAAVAIALVEADDADRGTALLLTRRASGLRSHGGQWALPGGRCDEGETPVAAALRELHEELGLKLGPDHVLGLLDDYPTRSGYLITPVVVWSEKAAVITPSPDEVASVHRIALEDIERTEAFDFTLIPESRRRVIRFRLAGQLIHAPTAALIYQFREVLAGRDTRVAELEQPVFAWK
jgi:8-oxo-dGTP pyrophosphatase MutT (NUDIX family)